MILVRALQPRLWGLPILAALLSSTLLTGTAFASHVPNSIDICCAWNGVLNDNNANGLADLTYSITGGGSVDQNTVNGAVQEWTTPLTNAGKPFELIKVTPDSGANIKIKLKAGGGVIAGMAKRNFDVNGFIRSVDLSISLKAFGRLNDQGTIAEVTRHEMGHALGINHANFDDLMDPTVGGSNTISACDVKAVMEAQHWKLADGLNTPHKPHVAYVQCP